MSDDTRGFRPSENADDQQRSGRGAAPPRRVLAGRYEVLEEIGAGATAITFRGRDRRLNRYVAIKIMRRDHELDTNFVKRFEREARTAASVSHGNVVDVYDVGQEDGNLFIVMQYIDGDDLKRLIVRGGGLPVERAREITRQVLAGIGAIHAAGIVHRDIKPQNVLIGRDGIARVTDFGIAQVAEDVGLTTAGTTVGTAAYMAPEQAQGGQLTEATDIYAVGVMLYEMLTGKMPFEAPTPMGMMLAHIQQHPGPPSERVGDKAIPAELDAIVLQAMAKNPVDRFRTASAMSRALEGISTTSLRTTVLPRAKNEQRTRPIVDPASVVAGAEADAAVASWPSESPSAAAAGRPIQLAPNNARRAGAGLRGVLGGLIFLLSLAVAGVSGYYIYDLVEGRGGGADPATEESTAAPTEPDPTAMATSASTEDAPEPTNVPAIGATETVEPAEPTATEVPVRRPTRVPTSEPTAVPTDVPAVAPTAVPTTVPTDVPTEVPTAEPTVVPSVVVIEPESPTEPVQVIEPINGQDAADDGGSGDGDDGEQGGANQPPSGISGNSLQTANTVPSRTELTDSGDGGQAAGQPATLGIESKGWKGDGSKHDNDQDWVVVDPGGSATASFDIASVPAGESFAIEIDLAVTGAGQAPLTVFLNGQELGRYADTLPVLPEGGTASDLGTLRITLPTAPLQDGKNEITIVNGAEVGDSEGEDDDDSGNRGNRGRGNGQDAVVPDNTLLLAESVITLDLSE